MNTILQQNQARKRALMSDYDPVRGIGCCGDRRQVPTPVHGLARAYVTATMTDDPTYPAVANNADAWRRLRCRHDFEYWCAVAVTIRDKLTGRDVPLILNAPQRKVVAVMESDRLAGRPIRLIILKARQWGGSTLVQMYMAWIQSCHRTNWHSLICAHVKDTASSIRGMYSKMLDAYPADLWDGDCAPEFKPFERSINVRTITGRGCRVTVASSENQEAVRGGDYAMAHLSEVAFWPETTHRSPADFIRAICGSIALQPLTLIAMESTANGVGNFFHTEWLRCRDGGGDKHCIFVPWHEIEIYSLPVADSEAETLWTSLTEYERGLWEQYPHITLEKLKWYHTKSAEYASHPQMCAEFPSDDVEAFANTGAAVFASAWVETLRGGCRRPDIVGDINADGTLATDPRGPLQVWQAPQPGARYVVAVDVGGRSAASDWSVIVVMKRPTPDAPAEVVAQWRGHVDHDYLAEKSRLVAVHYNNALLAIESNTLESAHSDDTPVEFVLDRLARCYPNVYRRNSPAAGSAPVGFHTNRATKGWVIAALIEKVRDNAYIERCDEACNELATYCRLPNGSYAAKDGFHDDMLMTRAIALHLIAAESRHTVAGFTTRRPVMW